MLSIREAVSSDAPALAQLAELTFREAFSSVNAIEDINLHCENSFGAIIQCQEIEDESTNTLLCEVEGRLVGYAQICSGASPACVASKNPAELRRLYVVQAYHGLGVAKGLMEASVAAVADRGADCLWLGVWEDNPRAISFYIKHGFTDVGEHTFQLGNDLQRDLVMLLALDN